jgi:apolipoprotein N-acyltransferase
MIHGNMSPLLELIVSFLLVAVVSAVTVAVCWVRIVILVLRTWNPVGFSSSRSFKPLERIVRVLAITLTAAALVCNPVVVWFKLEKVFSENDNLAIRLAVLAVCSILHWLITLLTLGLAQRILEKTTKTN